MSTKTMTLKVIIEESDEDNLRPLLEDALITAEEEEITKHPFEVSWQITENENS